MSHLEFAPNLEKYLYDDAIEELRENSRGLMVDKLTSLQHHANTWGLSSNKYFAENLVTKMGNLNKLDFSDTVGFQNRSDMPMGIQAVMEVVAN